MKNIVLKISFSLIIGGFVLLSFPSFSQEKERSYNLKIPEFPFPPKIDGKLENPLWDQGAILKKLHSIRTSRGSQTIRKNSGLSWLR